MRSISKAILCSSFLAIVFCLGMIAISSQPAAAKCPPGTLLTEIYRNIDSGKLVPGSGSQTLCLQSGKTAHLVASSSLSGKKGTYSFLFWDVNGKLRTTIGISVPTWKGEPAFSATAWYLFNPRCLTPGHCGGGNANVRTVGFQADQNKRIAGTPIASVSPASNGWKTPQTVVYTNASAVTITANNPLDFIYWRIFPPNPGVTAKGTALSAAQNSVAFAIAFYGPNPCHYISPPAPGELGPGASAAAYQAAAKYDIEQYNECVARHGGATPKP